LIDAVTGKIEVADEPEGFGPALLLSAFLATPLGRAAKVVVRNEPWRTLHIAACRIGGADFAVMLVFEGERLATVTLCLADPANALSYEALDAGHRRWLAANLRGGTRWRSEESERRFAWGMLWVGFDVKSGGPEIVVSYR
jgi:hypothetical protein